MPEAARHDDDRGQQRPERRTRISTQLKERLGKPAPHAGGDVRHARGFRMENRRTQSHHRGGKQDQSEVIRDGQGQQADQGQSHADGQGVRQGLPVERPPDQWLKERGRALKGKGDPPELGEGQMVRFPEQRIDRWDERLDRIIQQMGKTNGEQHGDDRWLHQRCCSGGSFFERGASLHSHQPRTSSGGLQPAETALTAL